jgi:putative selenate reductase
MAKEQVVHVDKMCNECGNCAVFCPYASAPYKDKFTVFASEEDMADSTNPGFCVLDQEAGKVKIRMGGAEYETVLAQDTTTHGAIKALIEAILKNYAYCL